MVIREVETQGSSDSQAPLANSGAAELPTGEHPPHFTLGLASQSPPAWGRSFGEHPEPMSLPLWLWMSKPTLALER